MARANVLHSPQPPGKQEILSPLLHANTGQQFSNLITKCCKSRGAIGPAHSLTMEDIFVADMKSGVQDCQRSGKLKIPTTILRLLSAPATVYSHWKSISKCLSSCLLLALHCNNTIYKSSSSLFMLCCWSINLANN